VTIFWEVWYEPHVNLKVDAVNRYGPQRSDDQRRGPFSGIHCHVVRWNSTDDLEDYVASTSYWFVAWRNLRTWRRRSYAPKPRLTFNGLHGVTSQNSSKLRSTDIHHTQLPPQLKNPDFAVIIVTRSRAGRPENRDSIPGGGWDYYFQRVQTSYLAISQDNAASFPGRQKLGRAAIHWQPSKAKVKNLWR
jgi:hypothetical protein